MLTVNSVKEGLVIDHIQAGYGIKIFNYLGLEDVKFPVALIMNVDSKKLGKKDIIKIESMIDINYAVLGLIDPNITIDIIQNEVMYKKLKLQLPDKVEDVIKCKNPRCITSVEKYIPHMFHLVDKSKGEYRCEYCDDIRTFNEI